MKAREFKIKQFKYECVFCNDAIGYKYIIDEYDQFKIDLNGCNKEICYCENTTLTDDTFHIRYYFNNIKYSIRYWISPCYYGDHNTEIRYYNDKNNNYNKWILITNLTADIPNLNKNQLEKLIKLHSIL